MDLEVVGRHAMLFDDDSMAEFVNSPGALVDWHSLSIDRYDVRHLLSAPPPLRSLRRRHAFPVDEESELDRERYLDLNSAPDALDSDRGEAESENAGGYNAVPFSYGNLGETTDQKSADAESGFRPPFSVPENLLHHLPPTEKVHQIIARTAMFVSKHGGQSEIVLRVKQGDNPTFGFLMPDHELHPYFRFLVDHQDLIKSGTDGNPVDEEDKNHEGVVQAGGSLSLLGSVYGSVEDEEGPTEAASPPAENHKVDTSVTAYRDVFGGLDPKRDDKISKKDEAVSKVPVTKERKIRLPNSVKAVAISDPKKESNFCGSNTSLERLQASASSSLSEMEAFVLEPSSDMKRVVDKIVEFILRNGREFEAVLVQQDSKHGRFPFLIPSNLYHPYYLKVLQKAQESQSGNKELSEKHESLRHGGDRKSVSDAGNISPSASDIPHDSDRKEKFKMVIGKSKKDGQDPASKATQSGSGFSVDTAAAAAILQAATKGIKYPNLSLLSKASVNGTGQGLSSEGGGPSGSSSLHSSQSQFILKPGVSVPVAKAIAKTVAAAAASEADSSEASLTEEQKLKAERLKRAKLFAAMIKSGAAPPKDDRLRALSVEPLGSGCSGSGTETMGVISREREGSSVPHVADSCVNIEKLDNIEFADVNNDRRSKRSYRSRSIKGMEDELADDEDAGMEVGGEAESEDDGRNQKHSRKKKRSHHSSHRSRDRHKQRRHSSSKDKDSRSRHKHGTTSKDEHLEKDTSSEDEHGQYRDRKQVSSSDDEYNRHSRLRKKHRDYSDDEHRHSKRRRNSPSIDERHSRHKRRYNGSSDDEHHHSRSRHVDGSSSDTKDRHARHGRKHGKASTKHGRKPQSEKGTDLEEGEIIAKSEQSRGSEGNDTKRRETSINLSTVSQDVSVANSTEVPDDLRAKVRAMLMATL